MKDNLKNKIIIITLGIIVICYVAFNVHKPAESNLDYCEELSFSINQINLKEFKCFSITEENEEVIFYFDSKDTGINLNYTIADIIKVKNYMTNYLIENPNNQLNMHKIRFVFKIMADESIYMYNYNFNTNQKFNNSYDFCSFKGLYVDNFSEIELLEDVYMIDVCATTIDDLSFLKKWSNIEYLRIYTSYITEEQKLYLNDILPECEIIYN